MPGAKRLGGNAVGLAPWATHDEGSVRVTAVPARHGPPGIELIDSVTTGFVLEWPGQKRGPLYVSGDTVYFAGIEQIASRFAVGTVILHLGGVRFPLTGPLHYTFTPDGARRAVAALGKPLVIPVHYEGWSHFASPRAAFEAALADKNVRWVPRGQSVDVEV